MKKCVYYVRASSIIYLPDGTKQKCNMMMEYTTIQLIESIDDIKHIIELINQSYEEEGYVVESTTVDFYSLLRIEDVTMEDL